MENERILAESKLCDIAKFRRIMVIIGIVLLAGTLAVMCVTDAIHKSHERADYADLGESWYTSSEKRYNENIEYYKSAEEKAAGGGYRSYILDDYASAEEYAAAKSISDAEAVKMGKDAYVQEYVDKKVREAKEEGYYGNGSDNLIYCIVGVGALALCALIGQLAYLAYRNNTITVTDKRVTGKTTWGKQVELPRNQISAIAMGGIKGVAIATSSGRIKFSLIKNRGEIFRTISDLLKEKQDSAPAAAAPALAPVIQQSTDADELAKYKSLLDSGAITQEEYDAKKKQILGL